MGEQTRKSPRWRRFVVAVGSTFVLVPSVLAAGIIMPSHVIDAHASTSTATVNEYAIPTASSAPTSITAGPDGDVWFTENSGNKIGKSDTSGNITEYALPTAGSAPQTITSGPDGALWFTETANNAIGRITISGAITEYPVPTAGSGPWGITTGPDGNLWFTEQSLGNVASVTTGGVFNEYSAGGCALGDITSGSDGNLWFLDLCGQIGKVTTGGSVTMSGFTFQCCPVDITAGPDGNLWVTTGDHNTGLGLLERVSTAMSVTRYQTPTASTTTPQNITVGPNGALWMTDSGDQIVESSTSGVMTDFPLPTTGVSPQGITAGPDGNIWFVENGGNAVGKLTVPASCAATGVSFDHTPVGPGVPLTATLSILNCGGSDTISGATTSTSTTPPSGCSSAPAITELSATVAPGQSAAQRTTFKGPSCTGDYAVTSTASAGGSTIGTAAGTYTTAIGAPVPYPNPGAAAGERPTYITPGPDGNLWFSENGGTSDIVRMTKRGAMTTFTTPQNAPGVVVWGPNGNVWFTDGFGPVFIGQMNSAGTVVSETQAPAGEQVENMSVGPDGNMWLIAKNGNTGNADLIRMTLAGKFKVYPNVLQSVGYNNLAIAAGPDGKIWFGGTDFIGNLTLAGHMTVFPAIGGGGSVRTITLGPDGNMWFTYQYSNVGRITLSGVVTLYPTATFAGPAVITPGADGNLWFSQIFSSTYEVARISPGGTITPFPVPNAEASNSQFGTTAGPDGNVWMAGYYGFNIVQIGIGPPATCTPVTGTAASSTVAKGSTQTITANITNCGNTPQLVKLVTKTTATCGPAVTTHSTVALLPHVGTTLSITSPVLHCPGTYKDKLTLSAGGTTLGTTTVAYTVS